RGTRPILEREFLSAGEDPPGNLGALFVFLPGQIVGVGSLFRVSIARGEEGRLITVLKKSRLGVGELGQLVDRVVAIPLGIGVPSIHGLSPVQLARAARNGPIVDIK